MLIDLFVHYVRTGNTIRDNKSGFVFFYVVIPCSHHGLAIKKFKHQQNNNLTMSTRVWFVCSSKRIQEVGLIEID